ncbi:MAG: hypothetical protein NT155_00595, partial [Candidatus Staskawiczbacteria bacterium]|nr:hypothetical protein [Candidatus Staskawiczbacteria bacterium]
KAYFVAKKLHKQVHFDIFHHVTYANDWMASYIGALLPVAYVRGPGGASPKIPKGFIDDYPLKDRFSEWFRSFGHLVSKCDPFYIIGQKKAKVILLCNNEALKTVSQKWKNKAQLFPVTGISSKELSFLDLNKKPKDNLNSKFSLVSAGKLMRIKGFDLAIRTFKMFNENQNRQTR